MPNILVTGAEGQLGQCFQGVTKEFPTFKFFFESKKTLNITEEDNLYKAYNKNPLDGIINCSAYSNVDKAEIETEKAYEINERGVQTLATFA